MYVANKELSKLDRINQFVVNLHFLTSCYTNPLINSLHFHNKYITHNVMHRAAVQNFNCKKNCKKPDPMQRHSSTHLD